MASTPRRSPWYQLRKPIWASTIARTSGGASASASSAAAISRRASPIWPRSIAKLPSSDARYRVRSSPLPISPSATVSTSSPRSSRSNGAVSPEALAWSAAKVASTNRERAAASSSGSTRSATERRTPSSSRKRGSCPGTRETSERSTRSTSTSPIVAASSGADAHSVVTVRAEKGAAWVSRRVSNAQWDSSSRSRLQLTAASSERCRPGRSRDSQVNSIPASMSRVSSSVPSTASRGAASSRARGSRSRRSAIPDNRWSARAGSTSECGPEAPVRIVTAEAVFSGSRRCTCSARSRNGACEVASTRRHGAASSAARSRATASRATSQVSTTSSTG